MKMYEIYNGFNTSLLSDNPNVEAKNGAEAVRKVLDRIGIKYTRIRRDKSNNVKMGVTPFRYGSDGQKYLNGKKSWYTVYNGDGILR